MDVTTRVLVTCGLIVSAVGVVDATITREWDLFVLFVLATAIQLAIWLRQGAHRTPVTIRPDLAHWIERQAEVTGEPHDDVLDRAIATYKHGLYADEQPRR